MGEILSLADGADEQDANDHSAGDVPERRTVRTEEVTPELLIDCSADGEPVGIEIVTPQAVSLEEIFAAFDRLGLPRPAESELRPLQVA